MSAPTALDLTGPQPWRPVPMPGANRDLDLVRLASSRDRFAIHGRFPAGFERLVPGGYAAPEELLVLEGQLELEGVTYRRGDLTVVPGWYRRTAMRSPDGCRLLAWFGGLPKFLPADRLEPCRESIASVRVDGRDELPASPVATWARGATPAGSGMLDVVAADLSRWQHGQWLDIGGDDLARRELR